MLEFLIYHYALNIEGGGSDLIDGLFFDDYWTILGPSEYEKHAVIDMGLTIEELRDISNAYYYIMRELKIAITKAGKFSWQQMFSIGGTCAHPLVHNTSCSLDLRTYCAEDSTTQTRSVMYAFSPGGCGGDPSKFENFDADLTNFLLVRGDYAWLGHGWLGCSRNYVFPEALNVDYGEPLGLCHETASKSGVFVREWSKATVKMDCNTWTPTITMK